MRESNSHQRFWRPLSYHLTNPLLYKAFDIPSKLHTLYHFSTSLCKEKLWPHGLYVRSSGRPISNGQLHASLHFHLRPIYLVVFKGSSTIKSGDLILGPASRLDAFSVYPFPSWLPGRAIGMTTGPPADGPSRSSRTKDSPPQISCARAG